jgi:hypothetical protein
MMAWRQLQISAEQHKQRLLSSATTVVPQMASPTSSNGGSLLTLQEMMFLHQQNFERRRLSDNNDSSVDDKMPKLTPISSINTCSSTTSSSSTSLPLSLVGMPLMGDMKLPYCNSDSQLASDTAFNSIISMSQREKHQNQQYLDRLRRMNERSKERLTRSRVNFEPSSVAKTVREELASRKQQSKNGKLKSFFFSSFIAYAIHI